MADTPYKEANLSYHPAKIWPDGTTLPPTLPTVGYGQILMMNTANGPRLYIRDATGAMTPCFASTTIIDQTVTNEVLPAPFSQVAILPPADDCPEVMTCTSTNGVKSVGWSRVLTLLDGFDIRTHRRGTHVSGDHTLQQGDIDCYVSCYSPLTITVAIPGVADGFFAQMWYEVEIARNGPGEVFISPNPGVTINGATAMISISKEYGIVVMKCIATDVWVAYGDMA